MPIWLRRIIFWIFVLTFLISAPMLVLYTAGFRYDLANGTITRTGVLSITSNPKNAQIYIDGEYSGVNTPDVLKQVMPGKYNIELRKDGYLAWLGEVDVNSGQATKLQNILLFLDSEPQLIFEKQTDNLTVEATGKTTAYSITQGGWQELWIFNPTQNSHTLLDRSMESEESEWNFSWSADGSYLFNFNKSTGTLDIYSNIGERIDFSFNEEILGAKWHPSADQSLLLTTKYGLTQFDVQTGATRSFTHDDETSVMLDASIIKLVSDGDYTQIAQYINGQKETLALLPVAQYTIIERDGSYLLLSDSTNGLYLVKIHQDQPILLHVDATTYDWNATTDMLAFTDGFELSVYNANTHQTELITRQSNIINSVIWHPDGNIIFVEDGAIRAHETYAIAKQRFVTTLQDNSQIDEFWVSQDGSLIYFYGMRNGAQGVYSLKLSETLTDLNIF